MKKKISHHLHVPNDPRGSSPELRHDFKDAGIVFHTLRSWLMGLTSSGIVIDRFVISIFRIGTATDPKGTMVEGARNGEGGLGGGDGGGGEGGGVGGAP